jgi:cytochrome c peroxidase
VLLADLDRRQLVLVADDEESAVQLVDVAAHAVVSTTKLDGAPGQMLLAPDGTLFVAVRGAAHVVALRFRADGTAHEVARHVTADEPFGLALTPDGATVLVTTVADPGVEALAANGLARAFMVPLPRDPRSVAVSEDGARAFVTHATGSVASVVDLVGADRGKARAVSLDARERRRDFGLRSSKKPRMPSPMTMHKTRDPGEVRVTMNRTATQGFGLAILGERVLLPETLVMTRDGDAVPSGYGSIASSTLGTHVPFVARLRTTDATLENRAFSGASDRACFEQKTECIVPRAVTDDGKHLYVACLDSDEVMIVDPELDAEHAPACRKTSKERPRLRVESPSGLAVDVAHAQLVAFSGFSRKVSVISLDGAQSPAAGEPREITLPRSEPLPDLVAEGRRLFHRSAEPRLAKNGRACASCHVDGRDDALVWPTPTGNRQTPMLAGRLEGTAPYGWRGEHASLVAHIASTVKNLEGTGLEAHELEALARYVASMRAPARQKLVAPATAVATEPRDAPASVAARGEGIFRSTEAGCSSCHTEETHFTDRETHALGAPGRRRGSSASGFDTPSLAFVGQTAPYFHDGRFATLEALVDGCEDPATGMGRTQHLDAADRAALVAYLRSL